MIVLKNFKVKLILAVIVGAISSLYQLEDSHELHIAQKNVTLNKNRKEAFEFISNLTEFPTWFPNINSIRQIDSGKQMGIGKRFKMSNTYLFGIGESISSITVSGHQKPVLFEYLCDNMLMERNRLEFKLLDKQKTMVSWNIYSRKKSVLFKYTIGILYKFYYSQLLREALFSLQLSTNRQKN
ncbi:hypothetical protein BpHYR1_034158 [Brachionus plicatilis]|uniref:Polyketide cyclase n=1 Tax=Brachionus plicatilis TaxID=10195 RepID=A0A3M7QR39_BRAPC|nr:hypothetical protein BpHYR1_034158 [Brachionus plicatilis]